VTLRWVRTKKKKKKAEIIKKNRAITRGEKSTISIGQIRATIPKTRVDGTITAPIKFPRIIQASPLLAEAIANQISGKALPKPVIKTPIKIIETLKFLAKN